MPLQLSSPDFTPGGEMPREATSDGENRSPALHWSGVPAEARSLALIIDDPDAPDPAAPRMTWAHWVLYNLPTSTEGLVAGIDPAALPAGTRTGKNDWRHPGYGGPSPPVGRHRYFHRLFALDVVLPDLGQPGRSQLLEAVRGHVVEEAELVGTYQKNR